MSKNFKIAISVILLCLAVTFFAYGFVAWGIISAISAALITLFYFFNEKMLLSFLFLKRNRMDKAKMLLGKIKNPEAELTKTQQGSYYFLLGSCQGEANVLKSEKFFKRAIAIGLKFSYYRVLAYLSLASVAIAKGNKREAEIMLREAKKSDKNNLFAEQLKLVKSQLAMVGAQKAMHRQGMISGNARGGRLIRR